MYIKQIKEINSDVVEAFLRLIPQLTSDSKPLQASDLQHILDFPCNYLFAAYSPHIIGTLTLVIMQTPSGSKAWIEDVVVDTSARGQGVGKMLLRHAIDHCSRLGVTSVNLTSRPERMAANKLYQDMGFELRDTNVYRLQIDKRAV